MANTEHTKYVRAVRVATGRPAVSEDCRVVVEQPVTIAIEGVGDYTLMCTPSDATALAAGFAFTEGLISKLSDILVLHRCEDDANTIRMRLSETCLQGTAQSRNLIIASSCGMCGLERIDEIIEGLPACGDTLRVSLSALLDVHEKMRSFQTIFDVTGGAHAAAIFTFDGEIVAFAEDVGRHNALDKAIGKRLLTPPRKGGVGGVAGYGAALSGRVSLELVAKAARAGIELIAAVSAPTSLGVRAAERCGITLCGFVRGDHATVYSHGSRVRTD